MIDFRANSSHKPTSTGHLWCLYNVLTTYSLAVPKYFSISYEGSEASIAKCVIFALPPISYHAISHVPRSTFMSHHQFSGSSLNSAQNMNSITDTFGPDPSTDVAAVTVEGPLHLTVHPIDYDEV